MANANVTITASSAEQTAQENNDAIVTFLLKDSVSGVASSLTSSTTVKVSVNPQGGATTADYGPLFYHMGTGVGGWQSVPNGGVITINAGFTAFELKTNIANDTITEGYDSLAFTVAQTTSSVGIADSWWVPSLVNLQDAQGTGTAAYHRSITADTTTPAAEGSTATATFSVSYDPLHPGAAPSFFANTQVKVSMYGLGGATAADYTNTNFLWRAGTSGGWSTVAGTGLITIDNTVTTFQLAREIKSDTIAETVEGISFNVAQTTSSIGLVDSWWVPSTVELQDAQGTGAAAWHRSITANEPTTPGMEGSTDPATATFTVWYDPTDLGAPDTAEYANTQVKVSMYGLGGATAADYTNGNFLWRVGTSGGWSTVAGTGLITIDNTVTTFQLAREIKSDTIAETVEGISFNVAQTTSSIGLVDSWWVPSTVELADVTSIYTTVTGAIGPDHFDATSNADMFVIPHGTSKAAADGTTGLYAGDYPIFESGQSFDRITGFTHLTDKIDLPATITVSNILSLGTYASEEALIADLQAGTAAGLAGVAGGVIGRYTVAGTPAPHTNIAYYLVDSNNTGAWIASEGDTFIKVVGTDAALLTAADFT